MLINLQRTLSGACRGKMQAGREALTTCVWCNDGVESLEHFNGDWFVIPCAQDAAQRWHGACLYCFLPAASRLQLTQCTLL